MEINYGLEKETRVRLLVYVARHHADTDPPVILWLVMSRTVIKSECPKCGKDHRDNILDGFQSLTMSTALSNTYVFSVVCPQMECQTKHDVYVEYTPDVVCTT